MSRTRARARPVDRAIAIVGRHRRVVTRRWSPHPPRARARSTARSRVAWDGSRVLKRLEGPCVRVGEDPSRARSRSREIRRARASLARVTIMFAVTAPLARAVVPTRAQKTQRSRGARCVASADASSRREAMSLFAVRARARGRDDGRSSARSRERDGRCGRAFVDLCGGIFDVFGFVAHGREDGGAGARLGRSR